MRKTVFGALIVAGLVVAAGAYVFVRGVTWTTSPWAQGTPVTSLDGVSVYDNGPLFVVSHRRHYAIDGYYYGQRWQCVEFIKRYLHDAKGHQMPNVMGHAISFYDPAVPHRGFNSERGMTQFAAGGDERPQSGDLLVFGGAGGYGHVGIVATTTNDFVEVVQQNKSPAREWIQLVPEGTGITLDSGLPVLGWLRVPAGTADIKP